MLREHGRRDTGRGMWGLVEKLCNYTNNVILRLYTIIYCVFVRCSDRYYYTIIIDQLIM